MTDNLGATGTTTVGIVVSANKPPIAHLSVSPGSSGTAPLDVSFDGSTSADQDPITLKSWSLDFADGTPAATGLGSVPSAIPHTYASAGTFNAKLTVTDSSDATASATVPITVNPQPTVNISDASGTEGQIENFVVTLSAVSTHNITVDYATADGSGPSAPATTRKRPARSRSRQVAAGRPRRTA